MVEASVDGALKQLGTTPMPMRAQPFQPGVPPQYAQPARNAQQLQQQQADYMTPDPHPYTPPPPHPQQQRVIVPTDPRQHQFNQYAQENLSQQRFQAMDRDSIAQMHEQARQDMEARRMQQIHNGFHTPPQQPQYQPQVQQHEQPSGSDEVSWML